MDHLYYRPWINPLEDWRYATDAHPPYFQRVYNQFREMEMGPQEAASQLEQGFGLRLYWVIGQHELDAVYDKKTGLFHKFEYEKPAPTIGITTQQSAEALIRVFGHHHPVPEPEPAIDDRGGRDMLVWYDAL